MSLLKCPKCEDSTLKRPSTGTHVLRCYSCGGMWLSPKEAKNLAYYGPVVADPVSLLPSSQPSLDEKSGFCPQGHGLLSRTRIEIATDEAFYTERCAHCGGLWFDKGEWQSLANNQLLHQLEDLWDPSWQRRNQLKRAEAQRRSQLVQVLGEDDLGHLERIAKRLKDHPMRREILAYFTDNISQAKKTDSK